MDEDTPIISNTNQTEQASDHTMTSDTQQPNMFSSVIVQESDNEQNPIANVTNEMIIDNTGTNVLNVVGDTSSFFEDSKMDVTSKGSGGIQTNLVDIDPSLQAVVASLTESEMAGFIEELNKTGKAYLPNLGQTIELLTVDTPTNIVSTTATSLSTQPNVIPSGVTNSSITVGQQSAESLLDDLTSLIQSPPAGNLESLLTNATSIQNPNNSTNPRIQLANVRSQSTNYIPQQRHYTTTSFYNTSTGTTQTGRQPVVASTYGGTPVVNNNRPGTALKSTITGGSIRKPQQQQDENRQTTSTGGAGERLFFGRAGGHPSSIGTQSYQNRTGLIPQASSIPPVRRSTMATEQRRPVSWFPSRIRRHSDDDNDGDSPNESYGPTRRSARIPKPKQDADFVTFPLLDREEQEREQNLNSMSLQTRGTLTASENDVIDDDDATYRASTTLNENNNRTNTARRPRTVAELRSSTTTGTNKPRDSIDKQRWLDDELFHIKSYVPLIMPQQITSPQTMKNKATMCKPIVNDKEIECKPLKNSMATQTESQYLIGDVPLVTLPVPIYMPSPVPTYRLFKPTALPIPVPVPVPILIPITGKAFKNIRDYVQSQRDLLPDDPYEAALILHAESLVRAENQTVTTTTTEKNGHHITSTTDDDMMDINNEYHRTDSFMSDIRSNIPVVDKLPELDLEGHYIDPQTSSDPEVQKLLRMLPDAGYRLKWTYGIEAFSQWCAQKNNSILYRTGEETATDKNNQFYKQDILTYHGDELNRALELFVQEVRRPNGEQYLPESIYYLCLGIQFFLNINGRQTDIFDPRYSEFNSALYAILQHYIPRKQRDSNTIVSIIDEDILYDCQQLGTIKPWPLLTTLLFQNSKYFNLKTVDAHTTISFANFGKYAQWIRTPNNQSQHMNYLRFYANNDDLKALINAPIVYEITELADDPGRCPIKSYDYYVSKCPESVRQSADLFYLRPISGQQLSENSLWFTNEPLLPAIIDQILERLRLIPDFYLQTTPVDTTNNNIT
ncbi:unnamed protein product [Didymodactylos carnosus]|uniref:DUF3504 domain-containing protein n=1 Tax=Didymodactylos carnosus TaxID=1234261 RepID=A0A814ME83_9BILA|nr:unnamed protein product [Didymodactylos carnosus]CAF1076825.1 unnamed protein product [Didymodactylos carnosus]CAF3663189.1 unnamed protein product [Didymodactylos carnosus]CAF3843217.1 unnamed protein product [Didymodactylos carnosus]